jgi:hypothetical protein
VFTRAKPYTPILRGVSWSNELYRQIIKLSPGRLMAGPSLVLSDLDRELIALLADIISRSPESDNETAEIPVLSDKEALYLLSLLEQLLENERFQAASLFSQAIWRREHDKMVRKIYVG